VVNRFYSSTADVLSAIFIYPIPYSKAQQFPVGGDLLVLRTTSPQNPCCGERMDHARAAPEESVQRRAKPDSLQLTRLVWRCLTPVCQCHRHREGAEGERQWRRCDRFRSLLFLQQMQAWPRPPTGSGTGFASQQEQPDTTRNMGREDHHGNTIAGGLNSRIPRPFQVKQRPHAGAGGAPREPSHAGTAPHLASAVLTWLPHAWAMASTAALRSHHADLSPPPSLVQHRNTPLSWRDRCSTKRSEQNPPSREGGYTSLLVAVIWWVVGFFLNTCYLLRCLQHPGHLWLLHSCPPVSPDLLEPLHHTSLFGPATAWASMVLSPVWLS